MYVLSFDIGIKNLAYCFFKLAEENSYEILDWNIIDIRNTSEQCCSLCEKDAKYAEGEIVYCLSHAKKHICLKVPKKEYTPAYLKKQKINILKEIAKENNIKYENLKKTELIQVIIAAFAKIYFQPIESAKFCNKISLFDIGKNIKEKFDIQFKKDYKIDYLLVENQLGPNALRMSIIQWMVIQYFITSDIFIHNIEIISPANKLQGIQTTSYSDRKKKSITKCIESIQNKDHIVFFQSHKKKDDLADCFIQGDWFIKNKIKSEGKK
jgi:hypothetical protein